MTDFTLSATVATPYAATLHAELAELAGDARERLWAMMSRLTHDLEDTHATRA